MTMKILIIGSGAVGAVYAQALAAAGCEVEFLVRDCDSPNAAMPRTLYRYGLFRGYREEQQNLKVHDRITGSYDQVWLCTPSDALGSKWLAGQLALIDERTPLIAWTPDILDIEVLRRLYPGPISQALIGLISFQSPLPGEQEPPPGIAYLALPGATVLHDDEYGREASRLLKAGGLPSSVRKDLQWWEARAAGVNICVMAALEQEDWSISRLRSSSRLGLAMGASREVVEASAAYLGENSRFFRLTPLGLILRSIMLLGPKLSPFPLEKYLHYHFDKVGSQTRQILKGWVQCCRDYNLPHERLDALLEGLD